MNEARFEDDLLIRSTLPKRLFCFAFIFHSTLCSKLLKTLLGDKQVASMGYFDSMKYDYILGTCFDCFFPF